MRAIVVAGMMVVAGVACGQEKWARDAVIGSVADITAGASFCGFTVDRSQIDAHLAASGFKRDDPTHSGALDRDFALHSMVWQGANAAAQTTSEGKAALQGRCGQLWDAFGPDGIVRKGLLSKK
ncbi:HdeA/HdeB family protein OS=Bosea thiooxidans OX=53254 GN=SAMN05660750_03322 PE=4 SV=1 [Bosea thiooxidans]|uniref:Uncharacterized protein n=1 Tax=Bosea thiooxidans TaxID=53254 RepID=A0A1T5FLA3_9HYPH|nr:hypothetical protein [Bosea thiooxidans]SKB96862.1 hypothetical protein SAMN05660750_03322 [Bosea thiooxidans]